MQKTQWLLKELWHKGINPLRVTGLKQAWLNSFRSVHLGFSDRISPDSWKIKMISKGNLRKWIGEKEQKLTTGLCPLEEGWCWIWYLFLFNNSAGPFWICVELCTIDPPHRKWYSFQKSLFPMHFLKYFKRHYCIWCARAAAILSQI